MKTIKTVLEGTVVVSSETPAVPSYLHFAQGLEYGGITEEEINPDLMQPIDGFRVGDEVFFRSPDASDCLDDSDPSVAEGTRLWFLGTIVAESTAPPTA
jgi:hypothetical protein